MRSRLVRLKIEMEIIISINEGNKGGSEFTGKDEERWVLMVYPQKYGSVSERWLKSFYLSFTKFMSHTLRLWERVVKEAEGRSR